MTRDPVDLADLARVLLGKDGASQYLPKEDVLKKGVGVGSRLDGLSVGILDSEWGTDPAAKWKWGSKEVVCGPTHSSPATFPPSSLSEPVTDLSPIPRKQNSLTQLRA